MPIVTVAMFSGRTQIEKDRLAEAITVVIQAPRRNWYASGIRV